MEKAFFVNIKRFKFETICTSTPEEHRCMKSVFILYCFAALTVDYSNPISQKDPFSITAAPTVILTASSISMHLFLYVTISIVTTYKGLVLWMLHIGSLKTK